eukprot:1157699-Pelagomonas_calceolata.AAC.1
MHFPSDVTCALIGLTCHEHPSSWHFECYKTPLIHFSVLTSHPLQCPQAIHFSAHNHPLQCPQAIHFSAHNHPLHCPQAIHFSAHKPSTSVPTSHPLQCSQAKMMLKASNSFCAALLLTQFRVSHRHRRQRRISSSTCAYWLPLTLCSLLFTRK